MEEEGGMGWEGKLTVAEMGFCEGGCGEGCGKEV